MMKDIPKHRPIELDQKTSDDLTNEAKNYKMEKIIMGQFSIDDTKDVVVAIAAFANAINSALEDGKITITLTPAIKLPAAVTGIANVPAELDELDDTEKNELLALVQDELDFDANTEEIVTRALIIITDIKSLVDFINVG